MGWGLGLFLATGVIISSFGISFVKALALAILAIILDPVRGFVHAGFEISKFADQRGLPVSTEGLSTVGQNSKVYLWTEFVHAEIKDKNRLLIAVTEPGSALTTRQDMAGRYSPRYGGFVICDLRMIKASPSEVSQVILHFNAY